MKQKSATVCGAGGFTGGHPVRRLRTEGFRVRDVDPRFNGHAGTQAGDFARNPENRPVREKPGPESAQPLREGVSRICESIAPARRHNPCHSRTAG